MDGVKDNLNTMMCLDIYLSSLNDEEYDKVKHAVKPVKTLPLISWDIAAPDFVKTIDEPKNPDSVVLGQLAVKNLWNIDIDSLLKERYEAVVVTTVNKEIYWASTGFTAMTGYSSHYAIGRNPNFLQGKNTSAETRKKIRQHLEAKKPFSGTIVNYRKNKEEYLCEVKIIPITNFNDEVTHFIALEREAV